MRSALAFAAGLALGLAQLGAGPTLFGEARAAPLLPLAAAAGWSAARGPGAAPPLLLGAALALGAASAERAGWFVIAMLPGAALLAAAEGAPPRRRLALAPTAAGLGAAGYAALLYLAAGRPGLLADGREEALAAALWTAAAAAACALLAWPLRPRPKQRAGLFR